ncbi:MAG: hypothetical protein K0Q68_1985 [Moraxellaceae bacterium]|jgi:hypothetical protein|nr:hypothetical protein [Moraxellaceae bacterium]
MSKCKEMTGRELGEKLLQSVLELKAGQAARTTTITPNERGDGAAQDRSFAIAACAARNRTPV